MYKMILIMLILTSCKKDYTCTCTTTLLTLNANGYPSTSSKQTIKTIYDTKSNAKTKCTGQDKTNANPNISCFLN